MKTGKTGRSLLSRSAFGVFRLAFLLVLLWAMVDPGCGTLPKILQNALGISFTTAAGMVSIMVGMLGMLGCLPLIIVTGVERASQDMPKNKDGDFP